MKNNVRFGACAYVKYKGGVLDEEPFDDHSQSTAKIILGSGQVVPGIEDALSEMAIGEERIVRLFPSEAYGSHDPDGIQVYPRSAFPFGSELSIGDLFQWTNPASGMPIPVRVIEASNDAIMVDFNHPLAGKTIEYWLKMENIVD